MDEWSGQGFWQQPDQRSDMDIITVEGAIFSQDGTKTCNRGGQTMKLATSPEQST